MTITYFKYGRFDYNCNDESEINQIIYDFSQYFNDKINFYD